MIKLAVACLLVVALVLGAIAGAHAWDRSRADEIAAGVRVGGLDLGGHTERSAKRVLRRELIEPLAKPVTVIHEGEDYTLHPEDLDVSADIRGMVAEALEVSRQGSLEERIVRYATAAELDHDIRPEVEHSSDAIDHFVDGVAAKVNVAAVDAQVVPTATRLKTAAGSDGTILREEKLRERIDRVIASAGDGSRTVRAPMEKVEPEVTEDELAIQYPTYITVDRNTFTLRLYRDLKLAKEYTVAIGAQGYETSAGTYAIQSQQVNPTWNVPDSEWAGELAGTTVPPGPDNPLKARWMGFNGAAGIHGTADVGSLGSSASHGCIRMAVPDVIELYDEVEVGTPVLIV